MRMMDEIRTYLENHTVEETLEYYEDAVLAANSASLSIQFCNRFENADVKEHEKIVIRSYNARHYYNFAKVANGTDIKLLKESALELKDPDVAILFASHYPEYGIDEEQKFIIELNDPNYAYMFANQVKGANIEKLEQIVIDSNNYKIACAFACDVKGANIEPLEDIVIASGDSEYIYFFAYYVEGANRERLINELKTLANVYSLINYSMDVNPIDDDEMISINYEDEKSKEVLQKYFTYNQTLKKEPIKRVNYH